MPKQLYTPTSSSPHIKSFRLFIRHRAHPNQIPYPKPEQIRR